MPALRPREHPRDRAQRVEAEAAAAPGRTGAKGQVTHVLDRGRRDRVARESVLVGGELQVRGARGIHGLSKVRFVGRIVVDPALLAGGGEHRGQGQLDVALGDLWLRVARGHGLALLGDADPSAQGGGRLCADRVALGAATATECTTSAMEHGEHDVRVVGSCGKRLLCIAQCDRRGDVADLLAGVRVADHHLELAIELAPQGVLRENIRRDRTRAVEILELLEQRHGAQLTGCETRGARQEHDLEQIRDLAREADDVALARPGTELAAGAPDHLERLEQLLSVGRDTVPVALRCDRTSEHFTEEGAPAGLVAIEIAGPSATREQLVGDAVMNVGVLAHVERGEVKAEHVSAAEGIAQLLIRNRAEPGAPQAAVEDLELVAIDLGVDVALVALLDRGAQPGLHVPKPLAPRLVRRSRSRACSDLGQPLAIDLERRLELGDRSLRPQG